MSQTLVQAGAPLQALPMYQDGSLSLVEYTNAQQRIKAGRPYMDLYEEIKRRNEADWYPSARRSINVYETRRDTWDYTPNTVMNMHLQTVDIIRNWLKPKDLVPQINLIPTGKQETEQLDNAMEEVASIKQAALERFMDKGALDDPFKMAILEAMKAGLGLVRTYIYPDILTRQTKISWESIPYDRIFIPNVDTWGKVNTIIQEHIVSDEEFSTYLDARMKDDLSYPSMSNLFTYDDAANGNEEDMLNGISVLEVNKLAHYNLNGDVVPYTQTFIRKSDGVVLSTRINPYGINKLPYCKPIIPRCGRGLNPITPFSAYEELHNALQLSLTREHEVLANTVLKWLCPLANTDEFRQFARSQEHDIFPISQDILQVLEQYNAKSLQELMMPFPVETQATFMEFLTDKSQLNKVEQIMLISGVKDIMMNEAKEHVTATAEKIKYKSNVLKLKDLWDQVKIAAEDVFEYSAEAIHRHVCNNRKQLFFMTGTVLRQNNPEDQIVQSILQDPEMSMHRISVNVESLQLDDDEINNLKIQDYRGILKEMYEQIANAKEPQEELEIRRTYKQLVLHVKGPNAIEASILDTLNEKIKDITKQVKEEQQDPSIKEQREKAAEEKAVRMDPTHQTNAIKLRTETIKFTNDERQRQLEYAKLNQKDELDKANVAVQMDKNDIDQQKADDLADYQSAQSIIAALDAATRRYVAEQEAEVEKQRLAYDKSKGNEIKPQDVSIETS